MANLQASYLNFNYTIDRCIDYFGLDGRVQKCDVFHLDVIRLGFHFKYLYLSINDWVDYSRVEASPVEILEDTIQHLKEIKYQFDYYFNAIWC